jgi:hypothetical protein
LRIVRSWVSPPADESRSRERSHAGDAVRNRPVRRRTLHRPPRAGTRPGPRYAAGPPAPDPCGRLRPLTFVERDDAVIPQAGPLRDNRAFLARLTLRAIEGSSYGAPCRRRSPCATPYSITKAGAASRFKPRVDLDLRLVRISKPAVANSGRRYVDGLGKRLRGARSLGCEAAHLVAVGTPTLDPTAQPVGVDDLGMDL